MIKAGSSPLAPLPRSLATQLLEGVRNLYGLPWRYGAKDPMRDGALDCSGLVVEAFRRQGIRLGAPSVTNAFVLWDQCVPITVPAPGDLAFFTWTVGTEARLHVALYQAPGRLVGAQGSQVGELWYRPSDPRDWWSQHLLGFRRVPLGLNVQGEVR